MKSAQEIINDCDGIFDREQFVQELRDAEFLNEFKGGKK